VARDKMGLSKIKVFPVPAMGRIALKHIPVFKKRVKGGIDGDGNRFKPYTRSYADYKSTSFKSRITGKRIPSMKERPTSTQISPPDLTVTGLMLRALKRKSYKNDNYVLGWKGEEAEKVQWNEEMGRDIISEIPDKEKAFVAKLLEQEVGKEFRKLKNVTITVGK